MSITLKYDETEYKADVIAWDRDSFFIDFNGYWSRVVGSIAQKIAENTTDNWGKFNLIRTETIKLLGINLDTGKFDLSSPINILPVNALPLLLASGLKNFLPDRKLDDLNNLFQTLIKKALQETQIYTKDSIIHKNLAVVKSINKKAKQILITNDSYENNDYFVKEAKLENDISESFSEANKEQLNHLLKDNFIFITSNQFVKDSYLKRDFKNILLVEDPNNISFHESTKVIKINIDGASKGNPGPASIGIVFYSDGKTLEEVSEFLGTHTNNFAEYTALIRALEVSKEKGFNNIEVCSDSELVVNQINKKYKVKDADIKDLFDKAYSLINTLKSFKITHVPREENLKADKLANNALKQQKH